jgi:hypothetical protein
MGSKNNHFPPICGLFWRPGGGGAGVLPLVAAALLGGAAAGCVTINIYFPAAAAEKAADKIIEEVWQLKEKGQAGEKKDSPKPDGQQQPSTKGDAK